jgi:Protein of unknown function (DUF2786)
MDIWKILDPLLAKTIENGATPDEAIVAAEEVKKFMAKYGIDMKAIIERKKWKIREANKRIKRFWRGKAKAASPVRRIDPKTEEVITKATASRTDVQRRPNK